MKITHLFTLLLLACTTQSHAVPMLVGPGVFGGATVIDFDTLAQDEPLTTQFIGQGVSFSGGAFGDANDAFFFPPAGNIIVAANFDSSFSPNNPIQISFTAPMTRVGFDALTDSDGIMQENLTVRTYQGATQTGAFTFFFGPFPDPQFIGVQDLMGGIDRLELEASTNFSGTFLFDNLRFGSLVAVPEPPMPLLLGIGVIVLVAVRRHALSSLTLAGKG